MKYKHRLAIAAGAALSLNMLLGVSSADDIFVSDNGKVGIGTNSPDEELHVKRYGRAALKVSSNSDNAVLDLTSGDITWKLYTNGDHDKLIVNGVKNGNNNYMAAFTSNGRLGIGTTNPDRGKLHVAGHAGYVNIGGFAWFAKEHDDNDYDYGWANGHSIKISIYANERVVGSEFNAFSDARIKMVQQLSDQNQDLKTLNKIEITDYTLHEQMGQGKVVKKVIGQQIRDVFPSAVNLSTDFVYDIMTNYRVVQGGIDLSLGKSLLPSLEVSPLVVGDKVKVLFDNDKDEILVVKSVSNGLVKFDKPIPSTINNVIVFGREVDDFHSVDYEALAMLNISATQALTQEKERLSRAVDSLTADNVSLRLDNARLKDELTSMKKALCQTQTFDFCD